MKIAAVIPTRNRASLATAAVRSLLEQDCPIEIFLSDNSPAPDDALRALSREEPRVHYLRPDSELSMGTHWDWAMRQAIARCDATHFTLHYDRKYSKPAAWGAMAAVAASQPELLITYPVDSISVDPPPLRLWQMPWSGRVLRVGTARVAALVAAGNVLAPGQALPVLTNCIVPRAVLTDIIERFGALCDAAGPDSCFAARFLALRHEFLHYDRPLAVMYASHRSAGAGLFRHRGGDFPDWQKTWGDRPWLFAAPIPGLTLGQNIFFHEYELVRRETGDRLPPIDRGGYLDELGRALVWVEDPQTRAELHRVLVEHGWKGTPAATPKQSIAARLRDRAMRLLIDRAGVVPAHISGYAFPDDATALRYALQYPRRRTNDTRHLAALQPTELA
ncbi:MAG TPA: glycosyltransferase family A protein [Thermoanaerobaculia bacterium]|nr:glycosyltransferase family A protein [Thermoanaerobaculia bacterium]